MRDLFELAKNDSETDYITRENIEKAKKGNVKKEFSETIKKESVKGRVIGYCRVSSEGQEYERQKNDIIKYAHDKQVMVNEFVTEKISSRKKDREIFNVVDKMTSSDTLIVTELSRLGRSVMEVNKICGALIERGVRLYVVDKDLTITDDIQSQTMLFALSMSAQLERDMISQRTKSGLKVVREKGVKLGRPSGKSKCDEHGPKIREWVELGLSQTAIAKLIGVNRGTLIKYLKREKIA